jgi:hypothetical protein
MWGLGSSTFSLCSTVCCGLAVRCLNESSLTASATAAGCLNWSALSGAAEVEALSQQRAEQLARRELWYAGT